MVFEEIHESVPIKIRPFIEPTTNSSQTPDKSKFLSNREGTRYTNFGAPPVGSDPKRESRHDPDGEVPRSFLTDDVDVEDLRLYYAALRAVTNESTEPVATWASSNKERNKLAHSVNGNQPAKRNFPGSKARAEHKKSTATQGGQKPRGAAKHRPEAKFTQTKNVDNRGRKGVTVTHTSMYCSVDTPFVANSYEGHEAQFNPGVEHILPYFHGVATSFVDYTVDACSFKFVTEVAEQDGLVRMAISYKNDEPRPLTDLAFSEVAGSVKTAPWENATITVNPARVHNLAKKLKVRTSHEDNLDGYDGMKFWWSLSHCPAASKHLGHIYVTVTFTFYTSRMASDTGSLTSGDSAAFCGNIAPPVAAVPGSTCYSLINVTDHNSIAGLTKHTETDGTFAGCSYFKVSRAMKVEVTASSTVTNTNTTIAATTVPYLRVTPRIGYAFETSNLGDSTTPILATATDTAGVGPVSDGAGLVAVDSVMYNHHSKAIIHMSPGYKYFYYFLNYASSDLDAIFLAAGRILHVSFKFLGMLEHLASFVSLDELETLERIKGPLHAPTDAQSQRLIRARVAKRMESGWEPSPYLKRYVADHKTCAPTKEMVADATTWDAGDYDEPRLGPKQAATHAGDSYREKVKRFNRLQAELDELEKVKSLSLN